MKKTDWPIRWDLLLRYRLIEIIALWEGRLTTNHICHSFGIGRQQASKDINTYLRELAPDNLVYDRHLKGYVPSPDFSPAVTTGHASEYQDLLARQTSLSDTFESLDISLPDSTIVRGPQRLVRPEVMRAAVTATRHGRVMKAEYASLSPAGVSQRTLEPHTLVCVGQNWHLRAWCDSNREFRDFALSRFRGKPETIRQRSRHTSQHDDDWNRQVSLIMVPDSRLNTVQQEIIAADYDMRDNRLELLTRAALAPYVLSGLGLGADSRHPDPMVQQLELANEEQLGIAESARERAIKAVAGL
ncbi:helix-turn-helix transcriptional regulator [Marinobacter orientalis]|uniref:WYL domain-containing protein n=1 Tax=Marinobacter orientalis TaxID=1928859 RepID=A0A7Y0NLQ4_9GAMM|nr:WYL domain-containing protein [Marinobacter orientalis]NMT62858.1 WYL domain-containing protein [Marinobacter orientalis]TGX51533.1 WYL domain-containing protein [Marinobacter orientalis]